MLLYFSYSIFSSKKMVAIFKGFSFYFSWEVVPRPLECWLTPANKRFLVIRRLIGRTEVNWALRIKKEDQYIRSAFQNAKDPPCEQRLLQCHNSSACLIGLLWTLDWPFNLVIQTNTTGVEQPTWTNMPCLLTHGVINSNMYFLYK